ncbi:caspase domain-containing protein [Mycena sanguinolenta]|nr:caspase domain-containing protein [Mycena sanguinolenta]
MQTSTEPECRVFALIIGIDVYKHIRGLKGCVNDANAFKDFLTQSLHVPDSESHIKFITNELATRQNILDSFKTHLIENTNIRPQGGDTIIIFYAGHGSRVRAPNNWCTPHGLVETICPHDEGKETSGEYIHGIPDYTVHNLLRKLAAEKGNNVTAIFDSCNSGGITRSKFTSRFAKTEIPIPRELDIEFMPGGRLAGYESIPQGFRYKHMQSHVLLAACRENQIAFEVEVGDLYRGRFSESLVRTLLRLQATSLGRTTYMDLLDHVGNWNDQDPQVEGEYKTRVLFNGTYPPIPGKSLPITPIELEGVLGAFKIKIGSVKGVVAGTEFLVKDANSNTLCYLRAHLVSLDHSILVAKDENRPLRNILPGSHLQATVSDWKHSEMMLKVFVGPDVDASTAFPDQRHDAALVKSLPTPRAFVQVNSSGAADVKLTQGEGNSLVIERLNDVFKENSLPITEFSLRPEEYSRLPIIMDSIAHFNYFLHRRNGGDPILDVRLEMHDLRNVSADLFSNRVAQVKHNEATEYCFTIRNASRHALFAYLFFFDPAEYTIEAWYTPPTTHVLLPASLHGETTKLPIGHGYGGNSFEFGLPEGKDIDTGFLKLFVSTEYLDMKWIAQNSPFHPDFNSSGRFIVKRTTEARHVWDAFRYVITLTRTW